MNKFKVFALILPIIIFAGLIYIANDRVPISLKTEDILPEFTTFIGENEIVKSTNSMVVTANPYASKAAMEILCKGGTALDAAVAAQMMLTLVEPQSSGIGGGAFILYYEKKSGKVYAYDGRETTPKKVNIKAFFDVNGKPKSLYELYTGGLTVGVPGVLKALEMAHEKHGRLPWKQLFSSSIRTAEEGFKVSGRLHAHLNANDRLKANEGAKKIYFMPNGTPYPEGSSIQNLELAKTFRIIASEGTSPFYNGEIARAIVSAVGKENNNPGEMELSDLENYRPVERTPVSINYRGYKIVGFPPPSSGGVTILETLGILSFFELKKIPFHSAKAVHLISSASNIAFADRDQYLADPDFENVPVQAMLDPGYLEKRAREIPPERAAGTALPGEFPGSTSGKIARLTSEVNSTTQISIVDAEGNAVSMTSSIEQAFGSGMTVRGFFLNNHLTDFTLDEQESKSSNRMMPGKRPRSSMSPTFVFDGKSGALTCVIGSPGGARIISYVTKALVALLDYSNDIQRAISTPNFSSRNGPLELEKDTSIALLQPELTQMGYTVKVIDLNSGLQGIWISEENELFGGADPRRDSLAVSGDECGRN